jgi:hypothetical protein
MIEAIEKYIATFDDRTIQRFRFIFNLIRESVSQEIEEKLWAKLPSFYHGENFVRLILFKDHINIEAKGITAHQDELQGYKVTPKGMLQIGHNQDIPAEILKLIFKESLVDI